MLNRCCGFIAICMIALAVSASAGTLTLEEAVKAAVKNNPQAAAADIDAAAAIIRLGEVRSSRLPKLNFEFSYIHLSEVPRLDVPPINIDLSDLGTALNGYFAGASQQLQALGMPGLPAFPTQLGKALTLPGFDLAEADTRRYTVSLQQPLYTGGRVRHGAAQVRSGAEALEAVAESKRRQIAYQVVETYLGARLAWRVAKVNDEAFNTIDWHVKQAESLYKQGMIPQYDLMRAQTELANQDRRRLDAHNQADLATAFLLDLMGAPSDDFPELTTELGVGGEIDADLEAAALISIEKSADMKALKARGRMYAAGVRAAKSELMPVVAAVASKELRDDDLSVMTPGEFMGIIVRMPLFDGGAARSKASYNRALMERNEADIKRLENGIRLEVRKYFLDLQSAGKALEVADVAVRLAGESLRLAERRFEVGEGTSIEVTDAILALSVAETNLDRAHYQYDVAYFGLRKSMGLIMDDFRVGGGD